MKLNTLTLTTLAAAIAPTLLPAQVQLQYVAGIDTGAAEIVSFDTATRTLLSTDSDGIDIIDFRDPANPQLLRTADLSGAFDIGENISSVAADPLGRGFAVATIFPTDDAVEFNDESAKQPGKLAVIDIATGAVLTYLNVGFHPDSVVFSKDGTLIIVSNEGEVKLDGQTQAPGSVSIVDISNMTDPAALSNTDVKTYDYSAANLADGVSIDGLRRNYESAEMYYDIEPEYSVYLDGKVYTNLQENNALSVLDVATGKYVAIHPYGTIEQTIDASDKDGILIDDKLHGMPMPDAIGGFLLNSVPYIFTANEGDAHIDDADAARVSKLNLDHTYLAELDALYPGMTEGALDDMALGRIEVSTIDGDTDADGDIDQIHMFGTRSFTIWNGTTGERVWDSGSDFEEYIRDNDAASWDEGRADAKGPEPEGILLVEIDGSTYAVIGMERMDSIFLYDVTDPTAPVFQSYHSTAINGLGDKPEGIAYAKVNGRHYIIVSSEENGDMVVFEMVMPAAWYDDPQFGWVYRYNGTYTGFVWFENLDAWTYIHSAEDSGMWTYIFR